MSDLFVIYENSLNSVNIKLTKIVEIFPNLSKGIYFIYKQKTKQNLQLMMQTTILKKLRF